MTRLVCLHQVVGAGVQEMLSYRSIPAWCTSEKVGTEVSEMEAAAARRVAVPQDYSTAGKRRTQGLHMDPE